MVLSSAIQLQLDCASIPAGQHERPIVVVIASYNNAAWYKFNLDSIFAQRYTNYRVIYIDDCSSDGTADLVQMYAALKGHARQVTIIRNKVRRKALANIYQAVHSCDDKEIIALVDGDDALIDDTVFSTLNTAYANEQVWMAYSNFVFLSNKKEGWGAAYPQDIISQNKFREWSGTPTHLRTFYAALFKKIKKEDLMCGDSFFEMTYDMAIMIPMIEMARFKHSMFISWPLYIYNDATPLNDHKVNKQFQQITDKYIRLKSKYKALESLF